jgi:PAS domain S-box-containing protein
MGKDIDYKNIFHHIPYPHFVLKVIGEDSYVLCDANKQALDYIKKEADDVFNQNLSECLDVDSFEYLQPYLKTISKEKQAQLIGMLPGLPRGTELSGFSMHPVLDDKGQVIAIDMMALPLDRHSSNLQRERDDAISLLTSVFDVSEVGIIVTDRNGRIVRVNDSFIRIYGWSRDELVGRDFIDMVAEDEREMARKNHEDFLKSGIRSSGEVKILRKDSKAANVLFTTATLELSNNRRFQVTTVMDITLRKQMELSLRMAKEQADTANHAKSAFLANMSHELRTPLNAIIGFSEMMMKETFGPVGSDKYIEYMGDIHLSARHLLEIINEVLDMSKIEAGRVELDEEQFDMTRLITAVTRMMASRAFSSGLDIVEDVDENLPAIYADPRLLRQILINLVGNAVKYSKTNGKVYVRGNLTPHGALQLIVEDEGIGIPKDRLSEALEPFGQVNRPHDSSGIQGTGLGLPIAKAMAELHGGSLTLESDRDQGTKVIIELPAFRVGKGDPLKTPIKSLVDGKK